MNKIRKILSFIIVFMLCTVTLNTGYTVKAEEKAGKSTIWVIGDSTVSAFNDSYYYPRYGYGTQLQQYVDSDKYEIKNIALSGRSSKSYINDSAYKTLLNGMKSGDYLIIGFGHNDEKAEEARYTNPNGTYTEEGSFANSLYINYIMPAKKVGCEVILCTPIVRRTETGKWQGSNLHVTKDSGNFQGGDYPEAIRSLGKELNIPVVDLTEKTKKLYDELGVNETMNLHAWTSSNSASIDNTHTNVWGASYNAYFIAKEIKDLNINNLSEAIINEKIAVAPTKEDTLIVNPEYIEIEYDSNLAQSELWDDADIWKGTVLGNVGGVIKKDNFSIAGTEDGKINIVVRNNKGKITNTDDGLAMYYYKVPSNSTFTLTATATINSLDYNNQVSFGLMARDAMYIDNNTTAALGDYVAAAPLKLADSKVWGSFARKSGVLTQGGTVKNTSLNVGDTIQLEIASNSDGYACTFGNEETITGGFDFPLTSIDAEYVYVGMFVARNADITFENVKLIVDGLEVTGGNTETPEVPVEPEIPEVPVEPEIPEVPVGPETPEVPVEPETPEVPVEPETPEVPVEPETPETPEESLPDVGEPEVPDTDKDDSLIVPDDEKEDSNIGGTTNGSGNVNNSLGNNNVTNNTINKNEIISDKNNLPVTGGNSSIVVVIAGLLITAMGTSLVIRKKEY